MKEVICSRSYTKNLDRLIKNNKKSEISRVQKYVNILSEGGELPSSIHPHQLEGKMKKYKSITIGYDCRLVYRIEGDTLYLADLGKHDDVYESKDMRESTSPLKTIKGSVIKRSRYGVGKEIGGQIYFHKDYVDKICPHLYDDARSILEEEYPDFEFNCLMYDKKKPDTLRFDEAPDFDTAREPIPGKMISVNVTTGECIERYSPQIWHHKWLWVMDDYTGFDVEESYEWSKTWLQKITNPSGYKEKWEDALRSAGLK